MARNRSIAGAKEVVHLVHQWALFVFKPLIAGVEALHLCAQLLHSPVAPLPLALQVFVIPRRRADAIGVRSVFGSDELGPAQLLDHLKLLVDTLLRLLDLADRERQSLEFQIHVRAC